MCACFSVRMARLVVFCVVTVLASAVASSNYIEPASVEVISLENDISMSPLFNRLNFFNRENSSEVNETPRSLFASIQLTAVPSTTPVTGTIRYTLGKRVANDRAVAHGANNQKWSVPQDVTLSLKYPNAGQGAIITYLEVVVDQSSNVGKAQVISGGIGQRYITVIIEAKNTYWFNYDATIYGL